MFRRDWTYYGQLKQHKVQIAHLQESGRIVLRVNDLIMFDETLVINKEEPKKVYPFFIDDELCELRVELIKDGTELEYEFSHSDYSTSKTGKKKKRLDRMQNYGVLFGFLFIGTIIAITIYVTANAIQIMRSIERGGIITTALVTKTGPSVSYTFNIHDEVHTGNTTAKAHTSGDFTSGLGLPIRSGDHFEVLYVPDNPKKNTLLLERPTAEQILIYKEDALDACIRALYKKMEDENVGSYCDCLKEGLYMKYGVEGLARLYALRDNIGDNGVFNDYYFNKFMSGIEQQRLDTLCQQHAAAQQN